MECEENVELKDFDTILVSGHVTTPFCITQSVDDKFALLVDDGVQIFELFPTPFSDQLSITFLRSWIPASTDLAFQNVIVDNKSNSFVWNLNRKEVYEIATDPTLISVVEKSIVASFITHCNFSPLINNESYFSCLTNNGVLLVYKWDIKIWRPVLNVSDLWINFWKTEVSDCSGNVDFNILKAKAYQLKIITMAWFEKPELIFVTGHEDGGICIWDVEISDEALKMNVCHYFHINGKPNYICLCETGHDKNFLLIIGTLLGTVKYVQFKLSHENKPERVGDEVELWSSEDFIKPSLIQYEEIGNYKYIFTVKNNVLLIQKLVIDENGCINIKTKWHDFLAPIVSFNEYQNSFVIGTRNHDLFTLFIHQTGYEVKKNIEVPMKPKHSTCFNCYGVATSKNKAIWIIASSAKVNYDVKTMRDTINLLVFIPKLKHFKSLSDLTYTGLIKQIAGKYKDIRLTEISDLLELKKCELLADPANYSEITSFDCSFSSIELKLMIWESKLKVYTQSVEIQDIISQCEYLLARQWCCSRRVYYSEIESELTDLQRQSLEIMEIFLNDRKGNSLKGGTCMVCGEVTPIDNIRISSCSNSHVFPRCSLSLLPCDTVPYGFCRLCDSSVLLDFISDNDYRCLFCDGLLVPDTRIIM